ncbi:HAMP domain-containing histidine kinase [Pontibacter sp. E15-1]|uniref:ATP-binding protein n=1 Tax=Pontibacter sp. E15-1 TaxID=2919918 RepID=UPI001F4FA0A0|nr:tetratricopeptide repeat-containing sensor histidine kinase [Pontibacter sp. E15-1]MCJ8163226.1 HAMP domain-containing histidine kinase [Pontibacter sp. E15-1]
MVNVCVGGATVQVKKSALLQPAVAASVAHTVDSLNDLAFKVKSHDLQRAFDLLHRASVLADNQRYVRGQAINALYEGGIYMQNGYDKRALSLYYTSLELSRSILDTLNIARANQQLANAFAQGDEPKQAETLYLQALEQFTLLNEAKDAVNIKNSLALFKLKQHKIPEALALLDAAQRESQQVGYTYGLKKAYFHRGLVHLKQNHLQAAEASFIKALDLDRQANDRYGMSLAESKLAQVASRKNDYAAAIAYGEAAWRDAEAISASQLMIDAVEELISVFRLQDNREELVHWQAVQIAKQKEVYEKEKNYTLDFLDILRQKQEGQLLAEKKALQAERLARNTNYILLAGTMALLLLASLALVWYNFYRKVKEYSVELELKNALIQHSAAELDKLYQAMAEQNKRLEEANQLKSRLFSIISHDLRGPLSSVHSVLDLLLTQPIPEAERLRVLGMMRHEMGGVMALLQNLLLWSKAQMEGEEIALEPLNLQLLVQENVQLLQGMAKQKDISIENTVNGGTFGLADKERLSFVLRNLLMNALKFSYPGGQVRVTSEEQEHTIVISVSDNGKGMSAAEMERLFKGSRHTTLGTAREKGTGLGLMLSKDFVESLQGSIRLESREGIATAFHVTLRKAQAEAGIASLPA